MLKDNFNRIIDSLEIKYVLSSMRKVVKPVELSNTLEKKDIIIESKNGHFSFGPDHKPLPPNHLYFVPRDSYIHFCHGHPPYDSLGADGFTSPEEREKYVRSIKPGDKWDQNDHIFNIIAFEVTVYGAVPFFSIMQLPSILMQPNEEISAIIHNIMTEEHGEKVGKQALIKKFMDQLVIHICRYIYDHQEYKSQISKLDYLLDKRLINIIEHIQNNLDQDLSNQKIADLAYVSRDYIGQFFKSLTNHNLQDYIENRRLEQAHYLLRSSTDSVQEIARRVGFKDPAYFSRRFRLKYNQKARDIRETDILMA